MVDKMEIKGTHQESFEFGLTSTTRVGSRKFVYPPDPVVPPGRVALYNRSGVLTEPVIIGFQEDVKMIRWVWTEIEGILYVTGFVKVRKWKE